MRRTLRTWLPLLFALWLLPFAAQARNQVTLEVDKDRLAMGDVLRCDVTFTIEDEDALSDQKQPSFEGFTVVDSNTSQQHYTQIVNFKASSQKILTTTYILQPKAVGTFAIGPASFVESGRRVESQRVNVQVVELKALAGSKAFGVGALSAPLSQEESRQPQLFLRLIAERPTVYEGEQLAVTLYLYTAQIELSRWAPAAPSQFPGFSSLRLDLPKNGEARRVIIGRSEYRVDPLDRFLLSAKEVGAHTVTPYRAKVLLGDGFFGGRWVDVASAPIELTVKPLPQEGRPEGFDPNNVGHFSLSATLDRRQTEVGQPLTYVLTLSGTVDAERLTLPTLPEVPGLKIYPPTQKKDSYQKGLRVESKRVAEYLIVPQAPGHYTIPALKMLSFDSEAGSYRTDESPSFEIEATPATGATTLGNGVAQGPVFKQNLEANLSDLRPLRPKSQFRSLTQGTAGGLGTWLAIGLPYALILLWLVGTGAAALAARLFASEAKKAERARRTLYSRLKAASAAPDNAFYADLKRYLLLGLAGLTDESLLGLTYDQLKARLAGVGLAEAKIGELLAILEACDAAPYTPGLFSPKDLLERAKRFDAGVTK